MVALLKQYSPFGTNLLSIDLTGDIDSAPDENSHEHEDSDIQDGWEEEHICSDEENDSIPHQHTQKPQALLVRHNITSSSAIPKSLNLDAADIGILVCDKLQFVADAAT